VSGLALLRTSDRLEEARRVLRSARFLEVAGLTGPARGLLPLLLLEPPVLVVVPRERDVEETAGDLGTLAREAGLAGEVLALPAPGPPPFRGLPRHVDASARRAKALLPNELFTIAEKRLQVPNGV